MMSNFTTGTVRRRVAVVSNTAWYLSNFRLNLMRELRAAGFEVLAVAPPDAYVERLRQAGIEFAPVRISGGGTNPLVEFGSMVALWRIFSKHRIDTVLSYTPKGNLYSGLACIAAGRTWVPNVSGLGRAFIQRSAATRVVTLMYRLTFRRARRVFFQNQDDLNTFVQTGLVPIALTEHLPGSGVDLVRFRPEPLVARPAEAPVFLLVARMLWDKGVGEFVAAARTVRQRHPQARFEMLGFADISNPSAIERTQLNAWVAEGIVSYHGPTDDVRPWLAQADCVVLPSYREGVPRSLLEAAATARPVITTDVPGCRDAVRDGETGFMCRPADAEDLADKMLRFIALSSADRLAMGRMARAFVEASFDERKVIQRYLDLLATA